MAKRTRKKLKGKKLEDRIAPGMIGGGIVDPGMVDVVDGDMTGEGDAAGGEMDQTQVDSNDGSSNEYVDDGNYVDDNVNTGEYDDGEDNHSEDAPNDDYNDQENYDEFDDSTTGEGEYVDDGPGTWQEPDWVTANADGSIHVEPPEGVVVEDGIANFPLEVANEELPMPDFAEIQDDGSINVALPSEATYVEETNSLVFDDSQFNPEEAPEEFDTFQNPNGSWTVSLPENGVEYDAESNTLNLNNDLANDLMPENVEIQDDGSVGVTLPEEGIEYNDDGTFDLSPEATHYMDDPPPEYVSDVEFANYNMDGSVTFEPPEEVNVNVEDGTMTFPHDSVDQFPVDEDVTFNSDGTMDLALGDSVDYDQANGTLTIPEGDYDTNTFADDSYHINPDSSLTATLPEGVDYNTDANSLHFDNYQSNEYLPDNLEYTDGGELNVNLPDATEYFDDGSFQVPTDHVDFVEQSAPDYIDAIDFTDCNGDGSYNCMPPENFELNIDEGELTIPHDAIDAYVHDDLSFNSDGTMDANVPEGTQYDAAANIITLPEGELNINELPEELSAYTNDDGSIGFALQDGMEFDSEAGIMHFDNYWTNELTPDPVEFAENGDCSINLPQDCEYHDDGSFTVPEYCSDFIENPDPGYVATGPDWVEANPDGSITVENIEQVTVDPDAGTVSMQTEYMAEQFDDYVDDDISFNNDGTMNFFPAEGTTFDAETNSITFPVGAEHMDEIPEQIDAHLNGDESITVNLADGMEYNGDDGSIHFDNYWTNELTPDSMEFNQDGTCTCDLPHDTYYQDDGSFQIPEDHADFIENPPHEYVDHGPDWATDNPDGSITVDTPDGATLDANAGTLTVPYDMAMEDMKEIMPEDMTFYADGTADIGVSEGTTFDADSGSLTFSAGEVHMDEIPKGIESSLNDDGTITVNLPEGMDFNPDLEVVHMSNDWINNFMPEEVDVNNDGEFVFNLPEDTQYFEDDKFVISAESAEHMGDDGQHHDEHDDHYGSGGGAQVA